MKIIRLIMGLFCCIPSYVIMAQPINFQTDRPRQTINTKTIDKKWIQLESGLFYQNSKRNSELVFTRFERPYFSLRYGLTNRLELRLSSALETRRFRFYERVTKARGISFAQAGAKLNFIQEKNLRPSISLTAHYRINNKSGKNGHLTDTADGGNFRLSFQHHISENVILDYGAGMEWLSFNYWERYHYNISPVVQLSEKWKIYGEISGILSKHAPPNHFTRLGGGYSPGERSCIELVVGKCWKTHEFTLVDIYPTVDVALQFAWKFNTGKSD